jgi:hypothetical protein
MTFPGENLDNLLTKQAAITMLIQALIAQLQEKGLLTEGDLKKMRARGLGYAQVLKEHGGSGAQIAGGRIEQDLLVIFEMLKHR